jgi:Tol biopolymer transport system component
MANDPFAGWVEVKLEITRYTVQPGKTVLIPVDLLNTGSVIDHLEFSLLGIPAGWLGASLPIVMLPAGESRTVTLVIQPPPPPHVRAGVYPLQLRLTSLRLQGRSVELDLLLTVAAETVQGPVGAYLAQRSFEVQPGGSLSFPLVVVNNHLKADQFTIASAGLPEGWISAAPAQVDLQPGEEAEIQFVLSPPLRPDSRAGVYPFNLRLSGVNNPAHTATLTCQLTVLPYQNYSLELLNPDLLPGEIGHLRLQNQGNEEDIYTLRFDSPQKKLTFQITSPPVESATSLRSPDGISRLMPWGIAREDGRVWFRGDQAGAYQGAVTYISPGETMEVEFDVLSLEPPAFRQAVEPFNVESASKRLSRQVRQGTAVIAPVGYPLVSQAVLILFFFAFSISFILFGFLVIRGEIALIPPRDTQAPTYIVLTEIPTVTWTPTSTLTPTFTQTVLTPTQTATGTQTQFTPTASPTSTQTPTPTPSNTPASPTVTATQPATTTPIIFPIQNMGRLAMETSIGGNPQLFVYDTSRLRFDLVYQSPAVDTQPAWSPDGRRLAFASNQDGQYEIYVLNLDTGVVFNLTRNPADDRYPAWSPDGQRIVFTTDRDGNQEIYSTTLDGGEVVNLTQHPANDLQPSWFIEQRIAFASDRDNNLEIYLMNPDGTGQFNLSNTPGFDDYDPAGAPDASLIAFTSNRDGNPEIYSMNLDGSNQTNLTRNPARDETPAWSPDSQWIAFATNRDANWEVYVMRRNGTQLYNVTSLPTEDRAPAWTNP